MTVSSTSRLAGPFTGTGADATNSFSFKVFAASELLVTRDDDPLTLNSDYTVSLNSDQDAAPGGSVTVLAAANTLSSSIVLLGNTPAQQPVSLPAQSVWYPKVVEKALDRLAMILQEQRRLLTGGESSLRMDLLTSTGAGIVNWIASGAGALTRAIRDKLRDTVCVKDYGAAGDYDIAVGTGTDDTAAFAAAIAALGAAGGRITIPNGMKCLVDANLTLTDNVVIEAHGNGRRGKYNDSEPNLLAFAPAVYLNPAATLTVGSCAGFRNVSIFRKGLAFNITAAQVAAQFTGAAITLADFACDSVVEHCTIIGFQYAVRTVASNNRANRARIRGNNIDCLYGIFLENAADLSHVCDNHGWPFVTVGSVDEAGAQLLRSGTFVHIGGTINDWTSISDNFCYGYAIGYRATDNVASVSFDQCKADHVVGLSDGGIGILVDGAAHEIRIVNPQVAAKQYGIKIDATDSGRISVMLTNPQVWSTTTVAILVNQGSADISEGALRGGTSGIKTGASAGKVTVDGTDLRGFTTALDNNSSAIHLQHRNCTFSTNTTNSANPFVPTIASAATLTPDAENDVFVVNGTTGITAIAHAATYAGKRISLQFAGSLTVTNGASLKLAGAADFSATADDILTLASDGTVWREASRSVN